MLKKTYRLRLLLLAFLSFFTFLIIECRLVDLQIRNHKTYASKARFQQSKKVYLSPSRGTILDREGDILATSYFNDTIILDPPRLRKQIEASPELRDQSGALAHDLAMALNLPPDKLRGYFERKNRQILMRKAEEKFSNAVALIEERYQLKPGVIVYEKHSKRRYPYQTLASHMLGFTTIDDKGDNIGLSGLELIHNDLLKGEYREEYIPINSLRQGLAPMSDDVIESTFGNTLVLSIDQRIQSFTESALRRGVGKFQALGGVALVMDVKTGELLALANCPDFDPNNFGQASATQRKNRALTDPIEIGSVMKIITTALLLDNNLLSPDEWIDCQNGYGVFDGRAIKDSHPIGVVPFRHAFAESSNIGLVTVGLRLEPSLYYDGLRRFGLGGKTGIDLPGEGVGILHPLKEWDKFSRSSLPMGYETALTAIQVITALSAIGNDGWRMRPHVLKEVRTAKGALVREVLPERVEQVASAETCRVILELMEEVVTEGTGTSAQIEGYRIGGKTGTTRKPTAKDAPRRHIASFAGLVPINDPRLAIYVYVDEPQGTAAKGTIYGGTVAAPIFKEIVLKATDLLGIAPNDPEAFEIAQKRRLGILDDTEEAETEETAIAETAEEESPLEETPPEPATDGDATPEYLKDSDGKRVKMPDLKGKTMLEVWETLALDDIQADVRGSGLVVRQEPAPGKAIRIGNTPLIIFAHPSESARTANTK